MNCTMDPKSGIRLVQTPPLPYYGIFTTCLTPKFSHQKNRMLQFNLKCLKFIKLPWNMPQLISATLWKISKISGPLFLKIICSALETSTLHVVSFSEHIREWTNNEPLQPSRVGRVRKESEQALLPQEPHKLTARSPLYGKISKWIRNLKK